MGQNNSVGKERKVVDTVNFVLKNRREKRVGRKSWVAHRVPKNQ